MILVDRLLLCQARLSRRVGDGLAVLGVGILLVAQTEPACTLFCLSLFAPIFALIDVMYCISVTKELDNCPKSVHSGIADRQYHVTLQYLK